MPARSSARRELPWLFRSVRLGLLAGQRAEVGGPGRGRPRHPSERPARQGGGARAGRARPGGALPSWRRRGVDSPLPASQTGCPLASASAAARAGQHTSAAGQRPPGLAQAPALPSGSLSRKRPSQPSPCPLRFPALCTGPLIGHRASSPPVSKGKRSSLPAQRSQPQAPASGALDGDLELQRLPSPSLAGAVGLRAGAAQADVPPPPFPHPSSPLPRFLLQFPRNDSHICLPPALPASQIFI